MRNFVRSLNFLAGLLLAFCVWWFWSLQKFPILLFLAFRKLLISQWHSTYLFYHLKFSLVLTAYLTSALIAVICIFVLYRLIPVRFSFLKKGLLFGFLFVFGTAIQAYPLVREQYYKNLQTPYAFDEARISLDKDLQDAIKMGGIQRCYSFQRGVIRAICISLFAKENKDPTICLQLKDETGQNGRESDSCIWDLTYWENPAVSLCRFMKDKNAAGRCIGSTLGKINDENTNPHADVKPDIPKDEALSYCSGMNESDPAYYLICVREVAVAYSDPAICETIGVSSSEKDYCFLQFAALSNDINQCEKIAFKGLRDFCISCTQREGSRGCIKNHP